MRRTLMLAAALAIPVSGVTMVGLTGPASAGTPKVTFVCTALTGTITTTLVVSGCTGGNTGGTSTPIPTTALATGGTITWSSGATTTIAAPTLVSSVGKHCPGYVKGAATNPTADKFSAVVTGGSGTNMPINGKASGEVCVGTDGSITALKPFKTKGQV